MMLNEKNDDINNYKNLEKNKELDNEISHILQKYEERRQKYEMFNVIYIFIVLVILYLIWYFTKHLSRENTFIIIGMLFIFVYVLKNEIMLAILLLLMLPNTIVDEISLGCTKTENGETKCQNVF